MHRRNIRGKDLAPDAFRNVGMLNAEKCVRYLRGIGVEIDDATADAWLDAQGAHRFLDSERANWRLVYRWTCRCGAMQGAQECGRGRKRLKRKTPPPKPRRGCGDPLASGRVGRRHLGSGDCLAQARERHHHTAPSEHDGQGHRRKG